MDVANDWGDASEDKGESEHRQRCKDFIESGAFNANEIKLDIKDLYHPGLNSILNKWDGAGPLAMRVSFPDSDLGRFGWQFILASLKERLKINLEVFSADTLDDDFHGYRIVGLPSREDLDAYEVARVAKQVERLKERESSTSLKFSTIEEISKLLTEKHEFKPPDPNIELDKMIARIKSESKALIGSEVIKTKNLR